MDCFRMLEKCRSSPCYWFLPKESGIVLALCLPFFLPQVAMDPCSGLIHVIPGVAITVAILAQGTLWAVAVPQAFHPCRGSNPGPLLFDLSGPTGLPVRVPDTASTPAVFLCIARLLFSVYWTPAVFRVCQGVQGMLSKQHKLNCNAVRDSWQTYLASVGRRSSSSLS